MQKHDSIYVTEISDGRWIAYDIPGNIGWIIYFVCCARLFHAGLQPHALIALIPALGMLLGIVELIAERVQKLDRILPKRRLLRGFGLLALSGILGMLVSLITFPLRGTLAAWMLVGAFLCAFFSALLFWGYRRKDPEDGILGI
ncbi:MAG: hypothetical protein IJ083_00065 [Clostridia bacterium]|nr:hypothetical protein [Clostridia bacterium]